MIIYIYKYLIYRKSFCSKERNQIQSDIFLNYLDYITYSFETLPEDMRMTKQQRIQFKISYDLMCDRHTNKMDGKNSVLLFAEYSKAHNFNIPLHSEFLMSIVNPYFNLSLIHI